MKRMGRNILAVVALVALIAACSSDGSSNDQPTTTPGTTDDSGPSVTTTLAPTSTSGQGSSQPSLEIVWFLDSFDPYSGNLAANVYVPALMPLITTDDGSNLTSDILESWESSSDAQSVTLTLRPDLQWSDGVPITSSDVVMSLTHYLDPNLSVWADAIGGVDGQEEFASGTADTITGLSAPDESTVVIRLAEPDPSFLTRLGGTQGFLVVLPHHILGDVPHNALLDHEYYRSLPVSSGAYQFVEHVDGEYIEFERNPTWSLGDAGFDRLFLRQAPPDVRPAMLETGEVQWIPNVVLTEVDRVSAFDGVEIQAVTGAAPYGWLLMSYEPLLDPRVRQAMLFAIDREGICEQVLLGYCSVPTTNVRLVAPDWAIPSSDMIEYNYDPDRARELLDEAGWDPSTELVFYNLTPQAHRQAAITVAQSNLADVGINWTVVDAELSAALEAIERSGGDDLQGFSGTFGQFNLDPSALRSFTACDAHFPAGQNQTHYCDPELDALWDAASAELDQDTRAAIYHEAIRRLNQNPDGIFLFVEEVVLAFDSRLQGVRAHPVNSQHLWNIGEWHWQD